MRKGEVRKMSHGLKLLLIAAGAIITCIVVVVGFQLTKSGKNDTNKAAEEYSAMIGDYDDIQMIWRFRVRM